MKSSFGKSTAALSAVMALAISLSGPASAQGTAQERSACMGDAFRFCGEYIPNVSEIKTCLIRNESRLHPDCRAEFQRPGNTRLRAEHFR